MPQMQLPIFPAELTAITPDVGFIRQEERIFYFHGQLPVFHHAVNDVATFRSYIAQLVVNGIATQAQIVQAFGIPAITVKRAVKKLREQGTAAFYALRRGRGPSVLTPERVSQAQALLDQGKKVGEVAAALGIQKDCVRKAVAAGRLHQPQAQPESSAEPPSAPSHKSQRAQADAQAPQGMATTRTQERVEASMGLLREAPPQFEELVDVPQGGVLLALPALLANGLLRHTSEHFDLPKGFYGLASIFLLLGFLALGRVKCLEKLRHLPPGEWGKLLGLDRIPEVRTLRTKLSHLAQAGQVEAWGKALSLEWMQGHEQLAGVLYVDGHVRVYHGEQTQLPRRYVARERLCLRGTTDYWVNDGLGQPFFLITAPINPGLVAMLREQIVPRLLKDVPGQPSAEQLQAEPRRHRFLLVYDREAYSPATMLEFWEQRIACLSYRKNPGEDWPAEEFAPVEVKLSNGEVVTMELAERGVYLGGGWMREIRRRRTGGHQTSIITTDFSTPAAVLAPTMFARWSQENFFKYMRDQFGLDRLIEYGTAKLPETARVINPQHRQLQGEIKKKAALLSRRQTEFLALTFLKPIEPRLVQIYVEVKAQLLEMMTGLDSQLVELKVRRKATPRHTTMQELPPEQRFAQLKPDKKHLIDTIKMIAYRAETALAWVLGSHLSRPAEARSVLQGLFATHVDLEPNPIEKTLKVRLHPLANLSDRAAIEKLYQHLNETETIFPGTDLRMIYESGSG